MTAPKALEHVLTAVPLFKEHLRSIKASTSGPAALAMLEPDGDPQHGDHELWKYVSALGRFRRMGDLTDRAHNSVITVFNDRAYAYERGMAFLTDNGVPRYWAQWALSE